MEANHSRQTALKHAVDEGKMGGIAAPHEELILEYYNDVRTGMPPNHLGANERASGRFGVVAREAHR
jgi:hypothetical protein